MPADESPLARLTRWEASGAPWRSRRLGPGRVAVELLTCDGEVVEELRSDDPALVHYLAAHPGADLRRP